VLRPEGLLGRTFRRWGHQPWTRRFLGPKVLTRVDRATHRLSGGRFIVSDLLFDSLVLTTTGRRSGQPRRSPLACFDLDGTRVVVGSNFGREHHPAWTHNLLADPRATLDHHGDVVEVVARPLTEDEQDRIWPQAIARWPAYAAYRDSTEGVRDIRMFALEPR
jgi:deazaflavin-dependent oxidoreductase (nitroreductase family)